MIEMTTDKSLREILQEKYNEVMYGADKNEGETNRINEINRKNTEAFIAEMERLSKQ